MAAYYSCNQIKTSKYSIWFDDKVMWVTNSLSNGWETGSSSIDYQNEYSSRAINI
jgi:hypothetical protein